MKINVHSLCYNTLKNSLKLRRFLSADPIIDALSLQTKRKRKTIDYIFNIDIYVLSRLLLSGKSTCFYSILFFFISLVFQISYMIILMRLTLLVCCLLHLK